MRSDLPCLTNTSMTGLIFAVLLALPIAGPSLAADPPPSEGVDVKKSKLLLLPKSTVRIRRRSSTAR